MSIKLQLPKLPAWLRRKKARRLRMQAAAARLPQGTALAGTVAQG